MGSIVKQPNGRWKARYRDTNGRSRSQTFDRKIDAERYLHRTGVELDRGEWMDPSLRRTFFKEWADIWWRTTVRLRPNTRRGYWILLQNHVLPYFGDFNMPALDYMDVETFIANKLSSGHGAKQVREMVTVVSLVMKCAVKAKARRDNPAAGHHLPTTRKRVHPSDVLTMEEMLKLVEHVVDPFKPAIWLLIFTGMRPAELCGLKVGSVDLLRCLVHVVDSRAPIPAFDGGSRHYVEGSIKTAASDRTIPIPRWLCDELAGVLAERVRKQGRPARLDEHLFHNLSGRPLNRDAFRARVVRPALRAAGLPDSFRTYDFRHTHASMLIDDGANLLAVAQRMGHTDPAITLRVYGHLFAGAQEQLTAALEARRVAAGGAPAGHNQPNSTRDTRRTREDTKRGSHMASSGQQRALQKGR